MATATGTQTTFNDERDVSQAEVNRKSDVGNKSKRFSADLNEQNEINRDIMKSNSEKGHYAAAGGGEPDGRIMVKGDPVMSPVEPETDEQRKERIDRTVEDRSNALGVLDIEEDDGETEDPITPASAVKRRGATAAEKGATEYARRAKRTVGVRFIQGYFPEHGGEKIPRGTEMELPITDARHLIESNIAMRIDEL